MGCDFEYNGIWYNEEQLKALFEDGNLYQKNNITSSKATSKTLEKVKEWLDRLGIEVKSLDLVRYEGINGVANLLDSIIQVADGKENVALPEESMHFAVDILKKTSSPLYTQMLNKINTYKIYKDLLNDNSPGSYKSKYLTKEGKPDIIKLKEEAIGKVLAEYLIQKEEGSTEKPELLLQTKTWLVNLIEWFKSLIKKAQFNPFEETVKEVFNLPTANLQEDFKELASKINIENIKSSIYGNILKELLEQGNFRGALSLLNNQLEDSATFSKVVDTFLGGDESLGREIISFAKEHTFLQINNSFADELVSKINTINTEFNLRKVEEKSLLNEEESSNHYLVTINGKDLKADRTTEYAKIENLRNTGGVDYFKNPTPEQKKEWDIKAMSGTSGHADIENIIKESTTNGYLKNPEDINIQFTPLTNKGVFSTLQKFLLGDDTTQGFLYTFPEGSKFYTEKTVYNPQAGKAGKAGRAGTIDLIVIPPKIEGEKQKILIYDWKFMGFSTKTNADIPKNKRQQHAIQLADYKNTIKKAILTKEQQDNTEILAQTIPIHATYKLDKEKLPVLQSVKIGNVNIQDEKKTYLLPVLAKDQSSGNIEVDKLIKKLEVHYKKIFQGAKSEEEKLERKQDANQLSIAIRNLQVKLNFEPIAVEAKNFQALVKNTLLKYKDITDPSILSELRDLANSAEVYAGIDEVFISEYGTENLGESEKTFNSLKNVSRESSLLLKQILKKEADILDTIALREIKQTILTPEVEVKGLLSSVTEANSLGLKTVALFTKLLNKARGYEAQNKKAVYEKFLDLFFKAGGQSVYEKIAKKDRLELIDKVSEDFKTKLKEAKKEENKDFFLANINHEEAKAIIKEKIDGRIAVINERESINYYNEDEGLNALEAERQRNNIRKTLDIFSDKFNGYDDSFFNSIFWKTLEIHEDNQSEEYGKIVKQPEVLEFYNFITEFNLKAKRLGYLGNSNTLRFLPLITGSTLEQLNSSGLSAFKNTLKDSLIVQINEEKQFGKTGESGKQEKTIPTYFTRTDKEYAQLSKDLPKIFEKYIESVLEFETNKSLESTYLSLLAMERNKDHLIIENGKVVFEGDNPKSFNGNELNSQQLEKVGDDAIYGIQESNSTWVDVAVGKIAKGSEEEKERMALSSKKVIEQGNALTQNLAVGLRALVTIPNFTGGNLQSVINAGGYFKGREFLKNERRIIGNVFSSKEGNKALAAVDYFIPLNDDVAKDVRRDELYKKDKLSWLKTWSFRDIMMFSNRLPDKTLELANALSWVENTIIRDGKFVNIRQWLRSQPEYQARYENPATLKAKESEFETQVEELKKEALTKIIEFKDGSPYFPNLTEQSSNYGEYRTKIIEYGRKNTGQMSKNNKADYRRSIIGRSFSMFKNWIIPQVQVRALDIQKNVLTDEWEYGRFRLYLKTLAHLGLKSFLKIRDIKSATPEGIRIMKEILEQKRQDYYLKTGQELTISDAEFFDMMRKELISETKELRLLLGLAALVLSAKLAAPDDDDDKNLYNMALKAVNKIYDEIGFYYNPLSIDSIQKGSILPSFGLVSKAYRMLTNLAEEVWGEVTDNQSLVDKAHPLKYAFNLIPFASQFQNDVLPVLFPEAAKEQGIKVSPQSRQQ